MDFYVVAFSDRALPRRRIHGRWYQSIRIGAIYVVGERRRSPPPLDDGELRHQHEVVTRLAADRPVLPVRFGAQTSRGALDRIIRPNEDELKRGLDDVRDRVQMNVRFVGARPHATAVTAPASGREYLERKRASAVAGLTAEAMTFLEGLGQIAVRRRVEPGTGNLLATAYHLVDRDRVDSYLEKAGDAGRAGAVVTGPFPPFAFTPAII